MKNGEHLKIEADKTDRSRRAIEGEVVGCAEARVRKKDGVETRQWGISSHAWGSAAQERFFVFIY